ncbi:MAG TPA: LacI family DNA-binding transcriptional regulator [Ohtaekwangia sp.]|uniref:LacI family DNA-binding transcriptional regulator n=1 Tax=Ohtaekwangia sp. TaxID=2066019 RepID=UPI002F953C5A
MSVTIKKIAKDLHLAVSTVSKALSDSHEISAETKARVFEYAARLDYIPNPYASSLKKGKSKNIAVVLPEVADSFFSVAINGIESVAQEKGYHTMVYLTHEDIKREQSIIRECRNGRVDGVLISVVGGNAQHEHLRDLYTSEVPLVFFDRVCEAIETARVVTNDYESGYIAAKHLIEQGCKRIAFLAMRGDLAITHHRQDGYEQALRDKGLDVRVIYCSDKEEENLALLRDILQQPDRPDGIIGSIEKVTMQVYTVCHALHIAIPQEVKIIGFSHLQIAALLNPSLTTVTQPAFEMGKAAATLLFKALEKKQDVKHEQIVIPSVLVPRASTHTTIYADKL